VYVLAGTDLAQIMADLDGVPNAPGCELCSAQGYPGFVPGTDEEEMSDLVKTCIENDLDVDFGYELDKEPLVLSWERCTRCNPLPA
jgi:hypothetical protein